MRETSELLTVKEVAEMLNTTPQTIRRWAKERFINAVRLKKSTGSNWTHCSGRCLAWRIFRQNRFCIASVANVANVANS